MSARRIAAYAASLFAITASQTIFADDVQQNEAIEVIGVTPVLGVGLPKEKIPYNVQSASSDDFDRTTSLDITDLMNRNFSSLVVNDAQNNPLQADVQYRGFTASPLLGLPQGLAVYQNGVRVNEVFGDTVNWDLLPEASIHSMNLVGGANPVFGLNTLGGAISIETKNGFNSVGTNFEVYGGMPQERIVLTAEHGNNNGTFGYYGLVQYLDEEGWRDASPSDSLNLYGALSYRNGTQTTLDLNVNYADNDLVGNGAIPIELAAQDYEAVFTSPDQTINEMLFIQGQGAHWLTDTIQLTGNAFYRVNETETFNGDGTEFEECDSTTGEVLIEIDDEDDIGTAGNVQCDGTEDLATIDGFDGVEVVEDQNGNAVDENNAFLAAAGIDEIDDLNGLNNRSDRTQEYYGGSLQSVFLQDLFGKSNQLIVGMAFNYGDVVFDSSQEIASLNADRSTSATGIFVPDEGTAINSETWSGSLYFTDTFSATDKLDLTFSGRFNHTDIKIADGLGRGFTESNPLLNGEHEYNRFNPAAGFTYKIQPGLTSYFSYSESSRAPTAVELACADANAPCSLPNGFLADPPLEQVVNKSFEGGFTGFMPSLGLLSNVSWSLGAFISTNNDDIIFQNTGGVSGNEGFFDNIGDTERIGIEVGLGGDLQKLDWFANYSYVEATFQDTFQASSANNSAAVDGLITVQKGDFIPNIPSHTLKLGGDYQYNQRFSFGGDLLYKSGVYVRGDESNQLDKLHGYTTVNIRAKYEVNNTFQVFARVNNLFDQEYESFGLLGEPDEVPGFGGFTNNKFVGVGSPISGFIGVKATF
jgi:iron complex outermembrane recepter protein